jgi:multimeric flavodoxin WrbA
MEVVGIVGGPRRDGNTAILVDEVLAGARESGNICHIFYLGDMEIKPLEWDGKGYIYPEDDFPHIMPHIESMGSLVLGTPIYFDHVSSRTKVFFDRLYYYSKSHGDEYYERFPKGVRGVNIISFGWNDPRAYDEVLEWMNGRMTNYWKMEILGNLKSHGTGVNPTKYNSELREKARELGRKI